MIAIHLGLLALVGLTIGSFLNVCIARLPAGESIVFPGSRCPSCRTPIAWHDNIPVLGYLVLNGRCRSCRAPISARYPAVEIVTSVAFVLQGLSVGPDPLLLASRLLFTATLIVLFGTDLDTQRLPNVVTFPGIAVGLALSFFTPVGWVSSFVGACLGAGVLLAVRWTWKLATGVDGMGLGDVKMLAMIGAFLGWRAIFIVLFLSSVVGALVGVALAVLQKRSMQSRLPFGTFLALAAFVASLVGDDLVAWYLGLF